MPKIKLKGSQKPREGALAEGVIRVPVGCLNPSRVHFYGHTLQMISQSGASWIRIHADWSITVGLPNKVRAKIPAVVACSRDRLHVQEYITAVTNNRTTDGMALELDEYDRELSAAVKIWQSESN